MQQNTQITREGCKKNVIFVPKSTFVREDLHKKLKALADETGRSEKSIINSALEAYFAPPAPKPETGKEQTA